MILLRGTATVDELSRAPRLPGQASFDYDEPGSAWWFVRRRGTRDGMVGLSSGARLVFDVRRVLRLPFRAAWDDALFSAIAEATSGRDAPRVRRDLETTGTVSAEVVRAAIWLAYVQRDGRDVVLPARVVLPRYGRLLGPAGPRTRVAPWREREGDAFALPSMGRAAGDVVPRAGAGSPPALGPATFNSDVWGEIYWFLAPPSGRRGELYVSSGARVLEDARQELDARDAQGWVAGLFQRAQARAEAGGVTGVTLPPVQGGQPIPRVWLKLLVWATYHSSQGGASFARLRLPAELGVPLLAAAARPSPSLRQTEAWIWDPTLATVDPFTVRGEGFDVTGGGGGAPPPLPRERGSRRRGRSVGLLELLAGAALIGSLR